MKKSCFKNLEKIEGGIQCGTVGILTGLSVSLSVISPGLGYDALTSLSSNIRNCWNS